MPRFRIFIFLILLPVFLSTVACKRKSITVPDDYATIKEAYAQVQDGGTITIKPGKYENSAAIMVNRNVTFCGSTGRAEDVIIDCPTSDAFQITGGSPSFQNLTVSSGAERSDGFAVTGGTPKLFHCTITSRKGAGMYVVGKEANPQVESCVMKDCGEFGLFVYDSARGEFKDCEIYGNVAGIVVATSGNPTVTGCKIHGGKDGVGVCENGRGKFKACEIYGNTLAGIEVETSGNPTVTGCKIHAGKPAGVLVSENGLGEFKDCEIYGNTLVGIGVYTSGNPTVTRCKIHNGKGGGVGVWENGRGKFKDCEIYGNIMGIGVKTFGNPTVTGCKIHNGKEGGVGVYDKGMGTFNNNTLEKNYTNGEPDNWDIQSDAGEVKGSGNTPEIPSNR